MVAIRQHGAASTGSAESQDYTNLRRRLSAIRTRGPPLLREQQQGIRIDDTIDYLQFGSGPPLNTSALDPRVALYLQPYKKVTAALREAGLQWVVVSYEIATQRTALTL